MTHLIVRAAMISAIGLWCGACDPKVTAAQQAAAVQKAEADPRFCRPEIVENFVGAGANQLPADLLPLAEEWGRCDRPCRRSEDATSCDKQSALYSEIAARGWCYGPDANMDFAWRSCEDIVLSH